MWSSPRKSPTRTVLSYQLVDPGAYVHKDDAAYETGWVDLPMADDGTGGDLVIGDSV